MTTRPSYSSENVLKESDSAMRAYSLKNGSLLSLDACRDQLARLSSVHDSDEFAHRMLDYLRSIRCGMDRLNAASYQKPLIDIDGPHWPTIWSSTGRFIEHVDFYIKTLGKKFLRRTRLHFVDFGCGNLWTGWLFAKLVRDRGFTGRLIIEGYDLDPVVLNLHDHLDWDAVGVNTLLAHCETIYAAGAFQSAREADFIYTYRPQQAKDHHTGYLQTLFFLKKNRAYLLPGDMDAFIKGDSGEAGYSPVAREVAFYAKRIESLQDEIRMLEEDLKGGGYGR